LDSTESILAEAHRLCRAVATQDLAGFPLYIVAQSTIAHTFGDAADLGGYTHPLLDLYLADWIAGYQGRGACFVINDIAIRRAAPNHFREQCLAIGLHELSHILDGPSLFAEVDTKPADVRSLAAQCAADVNRDMPAVGSLYASHEARYLRILIHLCHRAKLAGMPADIAHMIDAQGFGLSHVRAYANTLGDEPQRLVGHSFCDIKTIEPPAAFRELWADDQANADRIYAAATDRSSVYAAYATGAAVLRRMELEQELATD
jgi:hypothetical protein